MIYLTGDTHGDASRLSAKHFPQGKDLTGNDIVIVVGDFGMIWDNVPSKSEEYWLNWLSEKPWMTLFLDGNHENFTRLDALDEVKIFGGKAGRVNNTIFHLKRGEAYNIDGYKFFVFGGGKSIDKAQRIPDVSWWDRELPNYAEYRNGCHHLARFSHEFDYILTHDAPASIYVEMDKKYGLVKEGNFDLPKFLEKVRQSTSFKHWYFGHFHFNDTFDEKFSCLYHAVVQLGQKPTV